MAASRLAGLSVEALLPGNPRLGKRAFLGGVGKGEGRGHEPGAEAVGDEGQAVVRAVGEHVSLDPVRERRSFDQGDGFRWRGSVMSWSDQAVAALDGCLMHWHHAVMAGSSAVTIARSPTLFAVVTNGDHQTIRWEKNVIPGPLYAWSRWFASVRSSATHDVNADESLVFISAFAARSQGAIYAYQLDLATGRLRQLHTATDVEHPFFLALSPNSKLLFSIHAKTFGGKDHEEVAA